MSYNPYDYYGETLASRIEDERDAAARLDRECELAHAEALALELADAAAQDALDAITIYEYVDNSWLGIADGPVKVWKETKAIERDAARIRAINRELAAELAALPEVA